MIIEIVVVFCRLKPNENEGLGILGVDFQNIIFEFIGGLGIFLLGIKFMGDGLQKSVGYKLRDILEFTKNPYLGILAGIIFTVLIQSSTGVTVITVGLVSGGFMTLRQAIGVIMGANIGTTVTAFIVGIHISDYSLPLVFLGAVLLFFCKNKRLQNFGQIFFGTGALFFGLKLMKAGVMPLSTVPWFHELAVNMSVNPLLGVLFGTVFTIILQSSGLTVEILQDLFGQGLMEIHGALPVLFGNNIGTTITTVLATIGASIAAKRAALIHVVFNVIGTVIFMIFLPLFTIFIQYLQATFDLSPFMTIAFAHSSFNILNTLILIPLIGMLIWIVSKLIPGEDLMIEYKVKYLNPAFIGQSASIALGQAKEEILRMGRFAAHGLEESKDYQLTYSPKNSDTALKLEGAINHLDRKITDYLVLLSKSPMSKTESIEHSILMNTVRDFERIGDHFESVIKLVDYQSRYKAKITESAKKDLETMFELTIATVKDSISALDDKNINLATKVLKSEEEIDQMERILRKKHMRRVYEGKCTSSAGIVFVDIISSLERIGDHCVNIAEAVLGYRNQY